MVRLHIKLHITQLPVNYTFAECYLKALDIILNIMSLQSFRNGQEYRKIQFNVYHPDKYHETLI